MSRTLIQCNQLGKSFGERSLFEGVSFSIHRGERFALIGENGSGKTTLLGMLGGLVSFDEGEITRARELTVGLFEQEVIVSDEEISVRDFILEGPLTEMENQLKALEPHLDDPNALTQWSGLHEMYEQRGGYQRPPLEEVIHQLKLDIDLDVLMKTLSPGQKSRVFLAKLLFSSPDLLLLDEPTNHLDQEMTVWLENLLQSYSGAIVVVSHDRKFLNGSCNRLIELHNGSITAYGGSYDYYLQEKQKKIEKEIKAYEKSQEEKAHLKEKIRSLSFSRKSGSSRSDSDKLSYNFRGEGAQKSLKRNLENLKARLREIEEHPLVHPRPKSITGMVFPSEAIHSKVAFELEDVSKSFGENKVIAHLSKVIYAGDRIVITGRNGSGKSTLLKLLGGRLRSDEGLIRVAEQAKIAYLDQEITELSFECTPEEYFGKEFRLSQEELCRELFKAGLGGLELIKTPFGHLSVGQRKRMALLSLILVKPNILLLDEPTNHLDFATLEALEKSLRAFEGTLIAVSHDATFIEKMDVDVWIID